MRVFLTILFLFILGAMLFVTVRASLEQGIFAAGAALMPNRWFQATLADAYFGFVTFYVWVAYRERSWLPRIVWFTLIMLLGNIAMSLYVLHQLRLLPRGAGMSQLLLRRNDTPATHSVA